MEDRSESIDLFHNGFRVFLEALSLLAKPAEVQCEEMGDYNVAWELRDDVSAGEYLAKSNFGQLSPAEAAAIISFMPALKSVPVSELPAGSGRSANLAAMQHASWAPLRTQAANLLVLLGPATQRNASYIES
jgi:hypothetical protein